MAIIKKQLEKKSIQYSIEPIKSSTQRIDHIDDKGDETLPGYIS